MGSKMRLWVGACLRHGVDGVVISVGAHERNQSRDAGHPQQDRTRHVALGFHHLVGDPFHDRWLDAEVLLAHQGFAGQL